jgi:acyl-CoA thioester hydrolase
MILPPIFTRRVYYADTDAGGVMYHARYLEFAEAARTEALRAANLPHAKLVCEHGVSFIVQRANIAYVRPARLDDVVAISIFCHAVGGASVQLTQIFEVEQQLAARLDLRLGCIALASFRPARLPRPWRSVFDAFPPPPDALGGPAH